jgi:uncharacterized protein (TIGR00251 family)
VYYLHMEPKIVATETGIVVDVFVQPRSATDSIAGEYRGALKIKTTAPPIDDRANRAVQAQVAKWLGVSKSRVTLISGGSSRMKRLSVEGVGVEEFQAALVHVLSSRPHEPG